MQPSTLPPSFSILEKLGLRKSSPSITLQGIYVKHAAGYVKLKKHPAKRIDYANYHALPFADREDDLLELLVVNESFDRNSTRFYLCSMGLNGRVKQLEADITQINRYKHKVVFTNPVSDSDWLFVKDRTHFDTEVGVVALSHPVKHLVKLFSDMTKPAKLILPHLNKALVSYPENAALASLLPVWERKDRNLKDNKCFGLCEEQWEYYIYADNRCSKKAFLKRTKQFIVGYIRKFPNGLHTIEAQKRLLLVEKKLAEIS